MILGKVCAVTGVPFLPVNVVVSVTNVVITVCTAAQLVCVQHLTLLGSTISIR